MRPRYKVDFEKVKTLEDVKRILKVLDIGFTENCRGIDTIRDLLIDVDESKN